MRFPVESIPNLLAAVMMLALAIVLWRVANGRIVCKALAILFAEGACFNTTVFITHGQTTTDAVAIGLTVLAALGITDGLLIAWFAARYLAERRTVPRFLQRFTPYAVLALGLATLTLLRPDFAYDFSTFLTYERVADVPSDFDVPRGPAHIVDAFLDLAWPAIGMLLTHHALRIERGDQWRSTLLLGIGIGSVFVAIDAANIAFVSEVFARSILEGLFVVSNALLVAAWFAQLGYAAVTADPAKRRLAAVSLGVLLAIAIAGFSIPKLGLTSDEAQLWYHALFFIPQPLVITYALLRHQLMGFDAKVRFAISKSTIAAVFIAVFFVTSEVAQQFFGDRLGGAYVGIAAAGMLVFAIAPLQRAAERLAEKAVPVVPVAGPGEASAPHDSREADYREAVRLALRDRTLSRDEERHLIRIAHHMGIEPGRAMEIQDDVERRLKHRGH